MITKPSINLFQLQMHLLMDHINRNGGKSFKIHKFLYRMDFVGEVIYIKVNLADNLFFVFVKKNSGKPLMFQSMSELKTWFLEINKAK